MKKIAYSFLSSILGYIRNANKVKIEGNYYEYYISI
jgi:hypothetical protein